MPDERGYGCGCNNNNGILGGCSDNILLILLLICVFCSCGGFGR